MLAMGVIPLFLVSPALGLPLVLMIDALYFFGGDLRYEYESYFLTVWLLLGLVAVFALHRVVTATRGKVAE
ncbi:MAG: hypothetical protein HC888_06925 [Candidatus Competibacteraceae bacterium]|nr:hypothetical protein [Candidatus Competibacteraceae bacterium]